LRIEYFFENYFEYFLRIILNIFENYFEYF
jgi:hypothetical protein